MNKLRSKIPAMIAMAISLISFGFMLSSLYTLNAPSNGEAHHPSFAYWIFAVIMALFSFILYFLDALLSFYKAKLKIDARFNTALGIALIVIIAILTCTTYADTTIIIFWNVGHIAILVLEIISMARHKKAVAKS